MATVFERVKKIIVDQLGVEEKEVVSSASLIQDLNADSLDLQELVVALEEEFSTLNKKLEIPDKDFDKIATVQNVVDYIKGHGIGDN